MFKEYREGMVFAPKQSLKEYNFVVLVHFKHHHICARATPAIRTPSRSPISPSEPKTLLSIGAIPEVRASAEAAEAADTINCSY